MQPEINADKKVKTETNEDTFYLHCEEIFGDLVSFRSPLTSIADNASTIEKISENSLKETGSLILLNFK